MELSKVETGSCHGNLEVSCFEGVERSLEGVTGEWQRTDCRCRERTSTERGEGLPRIPWGLGGPKAKRLLTFRSED